jgi:beta-lactamase regulating signal transducer with metallopeptidase domain
MNAMPTATYWQALAEMFADRMLNSVAEGILIALAGWGLMRAMKGRSSGTRFAILFASLAAVVMLPVFEGVRAGAARGSAHSLLRLPNFVATDLFIGWAAIASLGLARIVFGFFQLRRLRQSCVTLDPAELNPLLGNTLAQTTSGRSVDLCVSDRVQVPTAMGFMKPAIVIPRWALNELTTTELNAVLLHEIAHLRRWDDWTNLAQKIVSALLFFHPAVWWIGRGLAREREMACDDFVLASTADYRGYAKCLVSVAEKSFLRRSLALAQALAGRAHLTAQRVARILDAGRPRRERSAAARIWKPALGVVASVTAVCLISLPRMTNLVAFDGGLATSSAETGTLQATPHFGAKVIPAAFVDRHAADLLRVDHPSNESAGKNLTHAKQVAVQPVRASSMANAIHRLPAPSDIAAKLAQRLPQAPRVVNARAGAESESNAGAPNATLVVMQSARIDEYGRVWTVSFWQLTVFHPDDRTLDPSSNHNMNPEIRERIARKEITPKTT